MWCSTLWNLLTSFVVHDLHFMNSELNEWIIFVIFVVSAHSTGFKLKIGAFIFQGIFAAVVGVLCCNCDVQKFSELDIWSWHCEWNVVQRIQYAKTKSDCVAKADGSFVPREKKKKQEEKGMYNMICYFL